LKSPQEVLDQILKDHEVLKADHFLNKDQGESGLKTTLAHKGRLQFLLQVVGLKVIGVVFVPLGTLPSVPFPLATSVSASLLAIFEPWVWYKPTATDPARASLPTQVLLHGSPPDPAKRKHSQQDREIVPQLLQSRMRIPRMRRNPYVRKSKSGLNVGNNNRKE
jgi:hypothetical protein